MKKIHQPQHQPPTGPLPEAYRNVFEPPADAFHDMPLESSTRPALQTQRSVREVPAARYGKINLKKYSSFKQSRTTIKLENQEIIAMEQLTPWLQSVDVTLNSMNLELIADVASFCEAFFIYGSESERKESIDRCIMECILPYCKDDGDVAKALLKSVDHRIVKSTKMSRRIAKLSNFFCSIVEIFWSVSARR